ncbi:uncharacterized protein LOC124771316 [Schistocerca piceifrons]|uniref:uncharacterized protein LOC124771316 n=1 Tax=Schistocerca piceifrons TaxID=274613 RepID=UPI001F5F588D|nr:uncharacterized protein LOC124771316 [Schistocerca piceifrons]
MSPLWHSDVTPLGARRAARRGEGLAEAIHELGLEVLNRPSFPPTFEGRRGATTNIDVTLKSAHAHLRAENWKVWRGTTLSDHNLITFTVAYDGEPPPQDQVNGIVKYNWRKADWDRLRGNLVVPNWPMDRIVDVDKAAEELTAAIQTAATAEGSGTREGKSRNVVDPANHRGNVRRLMPIVSGCYGGTTSTRFPWALGGRPRDLTPGGKECSSEDIEDPYPRTMVMVPPPPSATKVPSTGDTSTLSSPKSLSARGTPAPPAAPPAHINSSINKAPIAEGQPGPNTRNISGRGPPTGGAAVIVGPPSDATSPDRVAVPAFQCPECHRSFSTKSGLGVHRRRAHPGAENAEVNTLRTKARWSSEEPLRLAHAEALLTLEGTRFWNQELVKTFPHCSLEYIKCQCRARAYRNQVAEFVAALSASAERPRTSAAAAASPAGTSAVSLTPPSAEDPADQAILSALAALPPSGSKYRSVDDILALGHTPSNHVIMGMLPPAPNAIGRPVQPAKQNTAASRQFSQNPVMRQGEGGKEKEARRRRQGEGGKEKEARRRRQGEGGKEKEARRRRQGEGGKEKEARRRRQGEGGKEKEARRRRQGEGGKEKEARRRRQGEGGKEKEARRRRQGEGGKEKEARRRRQGEGGKEKEARRRRQGEGGKEKEARRRRQGEGGKEKEARRRRQGEGGKEKEARRRRQGEGGKEKEARRRRQGEGGKEKEARRRRQGEGGKEKEARRRRQGEEGKEKKARRRRQGEEGKEKKARRRRQGEEGKEKKARRRRQGEEGKEKKARRRRQGEEGKEKKARRRRQGEEGKEKKARRRRQGEEGKEKKARRRRQGEEGKEKKARRRRQGEEGKEKKARRRRQGEEGKEKKARRRRQGEEGKEKKARRRRQGEEGKEKKARRRRQGEEGKEKKARRRRQGEEGKCLSLSKSGKLFTYHGSKSFYSADQDLSLGVRDKLLAYHGSKSIHTAH